MTSQENKTAAETYGTASNGITYMALGSGEGDTVHFLTPVSPGPGTELSPGVAESWGKSSLPSFNILGCLVCLATGVTQGTQTCVERALFTLAHLPLSIHLTCSGKDFGVEENRVQILFPCTLLLEWLFAQTAEPV